MDAADYYTGIVAEGYAVLKGTHFPADRYADLIAASGEPALELGCGDGDPLLELRRRRLDVEGVDSSADMLARCAQRAAQAGLEVVTHRQRMEDLDLARRFATIFLAGPTFTLLPDDDLALRALAAIREHLTEGGIAEVPLWIPPPSEDLGTARHTETEHGTTLKFTPLTEQYDAAHRTRTTHVRYERVDPQKPDAVEVAERDWVIHWHTRESFATLAEVAGLEVVSMTDLDSGGVTGDEDQFEVTLTR